MLRSIQLVCMSRIMTFKSFGFITIFAMISMVGCATQGATHQMGPVLNDENLAQITPEMTKDQIIAKYGQPSFRCFTMNKHNLCYFHQSKKNDQVSEQRQVEIEFNENGKVKSVHVYEPTAIVNQKEK